MTIDSIFRDGVHCCPSRMIVTLTAVYLSVLFDCALMRFDIHSFADTSSGAPWQSLEPVPADAILEMYCLSLWNEKQPMRLYRTHSTCKIIEHLEIYLKKWLRDNSPEPIPVSNCFAVVRVLNNHGEIANALETGQSYLTSRNHLPNHYFAVLFSAPYRPGLHLVVR